MADAFAALGTWDVAHSAIGVISTAHPAPRAGGESDRVFALASVTKLLTATAVLVAVEEGSLSLDQPAGPPGSTIAHLMAHASGLGPDGRRLVAPGTRRIYSNGGFDVLGATLAEVTGMRFDTYLGEGVLEPLGMSHTRLIGSPASGAESTVTDLVRLAGAWLHPGEILSAATVSEASRPWFGELSGVLPGFGPQNPNLWGTRSRDPWDQVAPLDGHGQQHWHLWTFRAVRHLPVGRSRGGKSVGRADRPRVRPLGRATLAGRIRSGACRMSRSARAIRFNPCDSGLKG